MKPMIWHPEPKDERINEYLDNMNREPWVAIVGISILLLCSFTVLVLIGAF
ncbi:MAG: hypothetical protein AAGA75_23425 [Cyanobacteria bacterium P01_E01_bin.6]